MGCPKCGTLYDEEGLAFCHADGTPLEPHGHSPDALVGKVVQGRFAIERLLGSGGMGAVYLANQLSVDRKVALKILRREILDNPLAVRRFLLEAKATSRLTNPHTITVYDFGQTDDGMLFIAMEYLEGETLRRRLEKTSRLPVGEATRIIDQVADSLAEAHEAGIVHRDLKPDNIYLAKRSGAADVVKVLDFGIARAQSISGDMTMTKTGMVAGTPAYMAPETVTGQKVDARADVYALGVILYEMLTGRQPFSGTTPFMVMQSHLTYEPPPLARVLDPNRVPEPISIFVQRCLAKSAELRPKDAAAFRLELEHAISGHATVPNEPAAFDAAIGFDNTLAGPAPITAEEAARALGTGAQLGTYRTTESLGGARAKKGVPPVAIAAMAAVWLGIGGGAWYFLRGGETPPIEAKPPAVEPSSPAPAATIAPAPVEKVPEPAPPAPERALLEPPPAPPKAADKVALSIQSAPVGGATVLRGTEVLGPTPYLYEVEKSGTPIALTLRLAGYEDAALDVIPDRSKIVEGRLTPIPAAPSKRAVKPPAPAPKPPVAAPVVTKPPAPPAVTDPKPAAPAATPKKTKEDVLLD